ncbi:MAG: rod shape-determining protein RodA [Nitrospirota bacterium]|nr:rod shape-determining protein RodA [Nitrospirota bacterium]
MFTVDRRLFIHMDWRLVGLIAAILFVGITTIYSVTDQWSHGGAPLFLKQMIWAVAGLMVFTVLAAFDYHRLLGYAHYIFGFSILLLTAVLVLGKVGMGAQRWVQVGGLNIQPSELARLAVVLLLARYLADRVPPEGFRFRDMLIPSAFAFIPFVLVLKQPDLGSALMILFVFGVMLLISGVHPRSLMTGGLSGLLVLPFFWEWFWNSLHTYQRNRLVTFFNPEADPLGTGYHVIQSKIAIGAGGIAGQGFLQGSQSQLKFLPEGHTDFIFAVFAEQWGFLGVLVLISLFAALIWRGMDTAMKAKDLEGTLLAAGITCMLTFYVFVNLAMTLGMAPVVGVPLPLMSYGGTALVTTMAALGILANVHLQRHISLYR